jgi:hypothetical protein
MWGAFGNSKAKKNLYTCDTSGKYHGIKKWGTKPSVLTCKSVYENKGVLQDAKGKLVKSRKDLIVVKNFDIMNSVEKNEFVFRDGDLSQVLTKGMFCRSKKCGIYKAELVNPAISHENLETMQKFMEDQNNSRALVLYK